MSRGLLGLAELDRQQAINMGNASAQEMQRIENTNRGLDDARRSRKAAGIGGAAAAIGGSLALTGAVSPWGWAAAGAQLLGGLF